MMSRSMAAATAQTVKLTPEEQGWLSKASRSPMLWPPTGLSSCRVFFVDAAVKYHEPIMRRAAPQLLEEMSGFARF